MNIFVNVKEHLVLYDDKYGPDGEVEYIIKVLDYIINGKILFTDVVFNVIYEELLVMSTIYKNDDFLKIVELFSNTKEVCCAEV